MQTQQLKVEYHIEAFNKRETFLAQKSQLNEKNVLNIWYQVIFLDTYLTNHNMYSNLLSMTELIPELSLKSFLHKSTPLI